MLKIIDCAGIGHKGCIFLIPGGFLCSFDNHRRAPPSRFMQNGGTVQSHTQINEKLWEGRYSPIWPDGKKHARNVYAHSEEECEKLLADMIAEMKTEIAAEKERLKATPKAS